MKKIIIILVSIACICLIYLVIKNYFIPTSKVTNKNNKTTEMTETKNENSKNNIKPLTPDDFGLESFRIGVLNSKSIKEVFGEPKEIKGCGYYYNGLSVYFDDESNQNMITSFTINGGDFKTNRGIKIGDSIEMLFLKYGEAEKFEDKYTCAYEYSLNLTENVSYFDNTFKYILDFEIKDGKISSIYSAIVPIAPE